MPKANWGISSSDVDDFDRDSLYTPYQGEIPPNAVYQWWIKKLVFVAATDDSVPQLRVGLSLKPRNRREKKYEGYYTTAFIHISSKTGWKYVPFLDALGVSGTDFKSRTIIDEQGNISKIGQWKNNGEEVISAELRDNDPEYVHKNPKQIGWIGAPPEESDSDDEDEDDFDDESTSDDDDWDDGGEDSEEDDYEEPVKSPRTRKRTARSSGDKGGRATRRRRRA